MDAGAESLESEAAVEQPAPLEPRPDVLAAQALGLGHHLLDRDGPPADGGRQYTWSICMRQRWRTDQ